MPKTDLSLLKSLQSEVMDDLCCIVHVTRSSGTYSTQSTETRSMVSGVVCGIKFTNGQLKQGQTVLLIDYDIVLRLPSDIPVSLSDEVIVTQKGDTQVSGTFNVYSAPVVNSTVQHVNLKRVVS